MAQCEHLLNNTEAAPSGAQGCEECLALGMRWVHLRKCVACGHIGCCDSSPGRHASGHFNATAHPVIRSYEPGEDWRWCFVDQTLG